MPTLDYTSGGRIYLIEFEDELVLTNPGTFLPGSIEACLQPCGRPAPCRNQLLAEAMAALGMTAMQAAGIRRAFRIQQEKFFPLPEYDLSSDWQVTVTVHGGVLDSSYTRILFENPDFDLQTVYLLDRVQKHKPIPKEAVRELRKRGLVEGRASRLYLPVKQNLAKHAQKRSRGSFRLDGCRVQKRQDSGSLS